VSPPIPRLSSVGDSVCMILSQRILSPTRSVYTARRCMTLTLISSVFAVGEIVGATDLPQPKVNKCLIALVGRKAVGKSMVGVSDGLFLQVDSFFTGRDLQIDVIMRHVVR
jgi:hypothetical protein